MIDVILACALAGYEEGKREQERVSRLTPEEFEREMRLREVLAKERKAAAAERESKRRGFFVGRPG